MKRIAGSPGQRPKPTILQYFGTLTLAGREGSDRITKITNSIEIRLVDWGDGLRRVDIRRYVDTRKYTGPTSKGIALKRTEFERLLEVAPDILAAFGDAHAGPERADAPVSAEQRRRDS